MIRWLKSLSTTGKVLVGSIASVSLLAAIGGASPPPNPIPANAKTENSVKADHVEKKKVTDTQPVPFNTSNQEDPKLAKGQTAEAVAGVNGEKTITYEITYTNGKETSRVKLAEEVTKQPINQVVKIGTYVAPQLSCANGTYINSSGNTVCRPYASSSTPAGATAKCRDGTYSFSQSRRGTCSSHGGVAQWL